MRQCFFTRRFAHQYTAPRCTSTKPLAAKVLVASRITVRLTPKVSANAVSVGKKLPGSNAPSMICTDFLFAKIPPHLDRTIITLQPVPTHCPDVDGLMFLNCGPCAGLDFGHLAGQCGIVGKRNDAHPRKAGVGVEHLLQRVWRQIDMHSQLG